MELKDPEAGYHKAVLELEQLIHLLRTGKKKEEPGGKMLNRPVSFFNKEQFCSMVEKAKQYIQEGDIFQIVLSNYFHAPFEGSLLNTYRLLRTMNPSPYMFYFSGTDVEAAGASPETLVKLENGILHTFPLAGTRPRGNTEKQDKLLEQELLADEKELAEHNMLVDLGRNDLGKISKIGSVQIEEFHAIQRFSHVMHIGSTIRSENSQRERCPGCHRSSPAGRNPVRSAENQSLPDYPPAGKQQTGNLRWSHWLYRFHRQYGYLHCHPYCL